eukprot:CAMPEP_0194295646 /NCGR_PEP_ID=MMETSP0169-20130528/54014_1 /TAXON_ID=218684 /ORGANISM="Corethron pennatum, Strain L29A3" /LENGTH=975 /DNA_ID=CAMNT_0039044867 /DNA_START=230 /DNA_END=3157 /DNA_ORIENTATION=-
MGQCTSKPKAVSANPDPLKREAKKPKIESSPVRAEKDKPLQESAGKKVDVFRPKESAVPTPPSVGNDHYAPPSPGPKYATDNSYEVSLSDGPSKPPINVLDRSINGSCHSISGSRHKMSTSGSIIGLDEMINNRSTGTLAANVVHMEVPYGKPIEEVYEGVHTGQVLGSGIAGVVRKVKHTSTGVQYAVKAIELCNVDNEASLQQLREEIFIMCQLDHPNVVRLEEVYESHQQIYLVQELCLGGELFDRLDEQPDYHYTEQQCASLVRQMLCSLRYIHSKGIIHRDLKLENFLFSSADNDSELKMIDFGLSKHFEVGEAQRDAVGTPYTVAPEVIRGNYDEGCDVWAIGVITYLLLCGDPPFGGCGGPETLIQVRNNILRGSFAFEPSDIWDTVSDEAKDFIRHLLQVNPQKRPCAEEAQNHSWMTKMLTTGGQSKAGHQLNAKVVKSLVAFKEYSDMRKLLCEVLSFTMLPDQLKNLRSEFEKLDVDGSGEITLSSLKKVLMQNASVGSLGAFTEEEVEDIFDSMRVGKKETTIHWHEFIAAGLSQCAVDDRNLRIAFDRLDCDHKGYISLENITDLMGNDVTADSVQAMFAESLTACKSRQERITYEDFLLLMKGQTKEQQSPIVTSKTADTIPDLYLLPPRARSHSSEPDEGFNFKTFETVAQKGLTVTSEYENEMEDTNIGLSMDDDDDDEIKPLTPIPTFLTAAIRRRAKSYDESEDGTSSENLLEGFKKMRKPLDADINRALLLPERKKSMSENKIEEDKSILVANREMYRTHRMMRLAVIEASKQFEDSQKRRTMQAIAKESNIPFTAGLVMRRGFDANTSSESVRTEMMKQDLNRRQVVDRATRKGGRSRRKKTVSDMSAMMGPIMAQQENLRGSGLATIGAGSTKQNPLKKISLLDQQTIFEEVVGSGSMSPSNLTSSRSDNKFEVRRHSDKSQDTGSDPEAMIPLKEDTSIDIKELAKEFRKHMI